MLEGEHRPGHFEGVLTVVLKLLNIVRADKAYFGEKDYQQYKLIEGMTNAFFIFTKIILCETIREEDGLAFSSRNVRLTKDERTKASLFPAILKSNMNAEQVRNELEKMNFKVDYVKDLNDRRYGAVWLGKVRLIDNAKMNSSKNET
jgi:pantoate--beta-alanine ligase